jgi:N-acetylglutamate synthase-like GNAT family acetyltransferase
LYPLKLKLVFQVDGRSAGAVIWRSNETDPTLMDIRNISIDPAMNGRYFGAFMLRNAEFLMREQHPSVRTVQVDTKTTNPDMRAFLAQQGYTEAGVVDLYGSGKLDVLLHKTFGE